MDEDAGLTSQQTNGHSNHISDPDEMPKIKRTPRNPGNLPPPPPPPPEKQQGKKRSLSPQLDQQPRSSKRQRLQYQPFQSPGLGHIPMGKGGKSSEEKVTIFFKGEFLALRNENGSFFVCQAAQNVYKSSRRFKIRWLSRVDSKEEDLYTPDFYDFTDFECVLTNLRMDRMDKNIFQLPKSETDRTENILRRALNLENGIHEPELEPIEHGDSHTVDVSMVSDESTQKKIKIEKMSPSSRRIAHNENSRTATRRPSKQNELRLLRSTRGANSDNKKRILSKKVKMKNPRLKGKAKVNRDILQTRIVSPKKESTFDRTGRARKSPMREQLKPNNRVTLFNKDPTFESNANIPVVSVSAYSKLPIRAVLTKDTRLLQSLISDVTNVCSLSMQRSVDQPRDALTYALIQENHKAIQLLLKEQLSPNEKRVGVPESLLSSRSSGRNTLQFLGHAVREVTISRGSREGNNALVKDDPTTELSDQDYISAALTHGISKATLDIFCSAPCADKGRPRFLKETAISQVYRAVRCGHRRLAGQLVEEAIKLDGFGFNNLHKEVLLFDKQDLPSCRPASVKKRAFSVCGLTPIHCAAINPNPKYLSTLLAVEPEYQIPDRNMRRPIHYAVACEGTGPLDFLMSKGIRTDETDNDGSTILHVAAETGRSHNIELVLKRARADKITIDANPNRDFGLAGLNRPNKQTMTPLHIACISGHVDVVRVLLKYGADVERPSSAAKGKLTPLMVTCQQGNLEIMKLLIQHGARVGTRDKFKKTALTHAVINGHTHIASHLLRLGADPNTADSSGNTLIHYASAYGWWFCVKLLLESGAKPNITNDWKLTPLGVAFLKGHMGLVDLLLEQPGVDINFKDEKGVSLLMLAVSSPLSSSLVEQVQYLLEGRKADCSTLDPQGSTAFHWLARNSVRRNDLNDSVISTEAVAASLEIAKILLNFGCDPSVRNEQGQTALTLAIEQGNNELVQLLLRDGCQVTAEVDDTGENLLHNLVEHAWETDLASLIHIIKDSEPGKKTKKVPIEDAVELSIAKPVVPLISGVEGNFKIGSSLCVLGSCEASSDGFIVALLKGGNPEKDDVVLRLDFQLKDSLKKMAVVRASRVSDEWTQEEQVDATPAVTDGLAQFDVTIIIQKEVLQIMLGNNLIAEHTSSIPMDQISHFHITGKVNLETVQVKKLMMSPRSQPSSMSLPAEVLLEMAQTYSYDGFTPLLLACSKYLHATAKKQQARLRDMIKALIEEADSEVHAVVKKRSDDKARPIDGYSALHFLASAKEVVGVVDSHNTPVPTLQLVLNYKPPLNIRDNRGRTPLIIAIRSGQAAAAEALIAAGADINLFSDDEEEDGQSSPIVLAAKLGLVPIIKLLLKHRVNVAATDQKNLNTALHYAVCLKNAPDALEVVQLLVQAGVKVNSVNKAGLTPLHLAVNACTGSTDDSIEIEDYLIESKADVFAKDNLGRTPLHYAFVKLHKHADSSKIDPIEVVSLLTSVMRNNQLDLADNSGQTALHCAAFRGGTISCMHLTQRMSSLNAMDKNGNTALSLAIMGGHESCAVMLLQRGASIQGNVIIPPPEMSAEDKHKRSPWQWKPVAKSASPSQRSPILQEVARKDWQGVMYMMLDQLQSTGKDYFPAVEAALCTNKFRLALSLVARIKENAKLSACNKDGQNLLHLLALKAVPEQNTALQIRVAEVLVQRGLSLKATDSCGSYPLTYAALNKNTALCECFVDKMGVDAVTKCLSDKLGRSPITAAFWWIDDNKWKATNGHSIRKWCESLVQSSVLDLLGKFPAPLPYPGQVVLNHPQDNNIASASRQDWKITPLIHAVCCHAKELTHFLLRRGADINMADNQGCTPLMHAVRMNDVHIVKLLLNYDYAGEVSKGKTKSSPHVKSSTGKLAFRDNLILNTLPTKSKVARRPCDETDEENSEEVKSDEILAEELVNGDDNGEMEVEYESDAETPTAGDEDDVFRKTSDADLTQRDRDGRTVVHYVVQPYPGVSYENVTMLRVLADVGAPVTVADKTGVTPLQMAVAGRFYKMAAILQQLTGVESKVEVAPLPRIEVEDGVKRYLNASDYKADAAAFIEQTEGEGMEDGEDDSVLKPDPNTGMEDTGEILTDTELGLPYDVLLTKVDLSCGVWGRYNFYKMQAIHQKGKDLHFLFNRWGRIGTVGQFQQTPFRNLEDTVKEFCKIFKSKTGNNWSEIKTFQPQKKKYSLVTCEQRRRIKLRDIAINLQSDVPTKLPNSLQELMKDLTDVRMLQEACRDASIDINIMPFGRLSEKAINKGRQILNDLKDLVAEKNKLEDDIESREKLTEVCEKIVVMSNEYYQTLPQFGYAYEKVQPLESQSSLQTCCDQVENLAELEVTSQLLLGAQYRINDVNPLDYVYSAINCQIALMAEDDTDSQFILQYIHNTAHEQKPVVNGIYRVARASEASQDVDLGNRWLLWHGTSSANLISILTRGLQCGHPSSLPSLPHFNRGVYFADMFEKSRYFVKAFHNSDTRNHYILLCEVALGKVNDNVDGGCVEGPQDGHDSTKIVGTYFPDPVYNLTLSSGVTIPLGATTTKVNKNGAAVHRSTNYNEYIVFDRRQIRLRYIVSYYYEKDRRPKKSNQVPTHT